MFFLNYSPWSPPGSPGFPGCLLPAAAVSPSGRQLAIGGADRLGTVYLYDHPAIPG